MRTRSQLEVSLFISLLAVMFVLFVSAGCAVIAEKHQKVSAPQYVLQVQQDALPETSAWQTYRNEEYGFEFKYPPSLKIQASELPGSAFIILADKPEECGLGCEAILVSVEKVPDQETAEEYLQTKVSGITNPDLTRSDYGPVPLKERVTLPGLYPAYKFTFTPDNSKIIPSFPSEAQGFIYIFKDRYAYGIRWNMPSRFERVADEMYQTFKFIFH